MTESDPGLSGKEIPDAGTVGARRQEIGDTVPPGERMSLNLPPKELDATPAGVNPGAPPPGGRGEGRGGEEVPGAPGERRPAGGTAHGGGGAGVEAVRRDIQEDRRRLGDTVEALMRKTDLRGRARKRAARMGGELRRVGADTAGTAAGVAGRLGRVTPAGIRDAAGRVTAETGRPVVIVAVAAVLTLVAMRALGRRRGRGRVRPGGRVRLRPVGARAGRAARCLRTPE